MRAFLFPGQGSQQVGMGRELAEAFPAARDVFDEVDDALSDKLSLIMWEGPEDALTLTANAQPALMAVSLAVARVLEREFSIPLSRHARFVAGHSLGEYSALAAAGTFSLADAARLLRLRGRAMQEAVPVGEGAMAALLGLDFDAASEVAEKAANGEVCQAANDNAPGQVVVSGHVGAVNRAIDLAKERGARRAMLLPVSAPFHCALMQPAANAMAEALAETAMNAPAPILVANIAAAPSETVDAIRAGLVAQVTGTVRWRESVAYMAEEGVEHFVELGAGKVLTGLVKRITSGAEATNAGTPAEIEALARAIAG